MRFIILSTQPPRLPSPPPRKKKLLKHPLLSTLPATTLPCIQMVSQFRYLLRLRACVKKRITRECFAFYVCIPSVSMVKSKITELIHVITPFQFSSQHHASMLFRYLKSYTEDAHTWWKKITYFPENKDKKREDIHK